MNNAWKEMANLVDLQTLVLTYWLQFETQRSKRADQMVLMTLAFGQYPRAATSRTFPCQSTRE